MPITAERLEVEVSADTSSAKRELDSFNRNVTSTTTKSGAAATAMGQKFKGAALLVKAAAGTMAVSLAGKTIMAASDLNENLSKVGVVFGPAKDRVIAGAQEMADKFGMTKSVFLDAAGGLGLVAKASGLSQNAAAGLSVKMAKLAADASSFYNVPVEDALAAMKSGLVGEAEPMRAFGVLLSEAAVKTEAVRLGIAKQNDELTEGQKVQARSSLIMKGMADAHGDLARTQGSVANRLREIKGRLTNFAADMGTKALPAVSAFLSGLIKAPKVIGGVIQKVKDWANGSETISLAMGLAKTAVGLFVDVVKRVPQVFSSVSGAVQEFIDKHSWVKVVLDHAAVAVGAFVAALLGVMAVQKVIAVINALRIAVLAFNASLMANPVGLIIAAVVALAAVVYVAYKRFKPFRELVNSIGAAIKDALGATVDWVKAKWQAWGPTIVKVVQGIYSGIKVYLGLMVAYWRTVFTVVSAVVKVAFDLISGYVKFMLPLWKAGFQAIYGVVKVVFDTIVSFIKAAIQVVKGVINVVMGAIHGDWARVWKGIQQIVGGAWAYIKALVKGGINLVKAVIQGGLGVIRAIWGRVWAVIGGTVRAVWNGIRNVVSGAINGVKSLVTNGVNNTKASWSAGWNAIKSILTNTWNAIKNAVTNAVSKVVHTVIGLRQKISAGLSGIVGWLAQAGRDLIQGMVNGVKDMAGSLVDSVKDAVGGAIDGAKGLLGIHSPSRVFHAIGKNTVQGLVNGIHDHKDGAAKAAAALAVKIVQGFKDAARRGKKAVRKYLDSMTSWVKRVFQGEDEKRLLGRIKDLGKRARELVEREAKITERLKDALAKRARLREAKSSLIDSMRQGISSQATVLNAGNNASTIAQSLTAQVAKVKQFVRLLKRMKKMGYSKEIISQVASAGVEGGLEAAKALVAASADDQAAIQSAFSTINKIAKNQSQAMGNSLYNAGIKAADGVVKGLQKRRKAIEDMLMNVAKAMEAAIRHALGLAGKDHKGKGGKDDKDKGRGKTSQRVSAALGGAGVDTTPRSGPRGPGNGPNGPRRGPGPAAMGGGRDRGDVHFHFHTENPVAEPQSRTTNKALDRVASLGLL